MKYIKYIVEKVFSFCLNISGFVVHYTPNL